MQQSPRVLRHHFTFHLLTLQQYGSLPGFRTVFIPTVLNSMSSPTFFLTPSGDNPKPTIVCIKVKNG